MSEHHAKARVTLTIEVPVSDIWGDDCTVAQIKKQATESALTKISKGLWHNDFNVIGQPVVTAVLVDKL